MNSMPSSVTKIVGVSILAVCMFSFGFASGKVFDGNLFSGKGSSSENVKFTGDVNGKDVKNINFDRFWDVWNTMNDQYVDAGKVSQEDMFYGSIKGMVASYDDPATLYLDPKETEQFNNSTQGKLFSGIGAELGYENGQISVISPLSGSPAEKAGIRPGDIILKIDGKEIKSSESIYDVVLKIRGEAGTNVTLTILRKDGSDQQDLTITRGEITVPSMEVKKTDNKDVAVIDVARFTDSSLAEWESNWDKSVDEVINSGAKALVIDLRGNPGGFLDGAVYAGSEFLPKGSVVVKQQDREGKVNDYKVARDGRLLDIPVVVLVNDGSASASEILAGGLQKNGRAVILGETTYGKGTAQQVMDFSDGSSLHITVLKWLLPDGTWLNRDNPIKPDTEIKYTDEDFKNGTDPQLEGALKYLESKI